jgi:hypothetical protein
MATSLAEFGDPISDQSMVIMLLCGLNGQFHHMVSILKMHRPFSDVCGGSNSSPAGGDRAQGTTTITILDPCHPCASLANDLCDIDCDEEVGYRIPLVKLCSPTHDPITEKIVHYQR